MIYAVRRRNENNEKLMRRFKKQTQKQGVVKKGRQNRYFIKDKTRRRVRDEAVSRTKYRALKVQRILWS